MKIDRKAVHNKYGGRCAYCGEQVEFKAMQVDHIYAKARFHIAEVVHGVDYKLDDFRNLNPSCRKCNNYKSVLTVDEFRAELDKQGPRLLARSTAFNRALRFGQVKIKRSPIVFYFETEPINTEGE